MNNYTPLPSTPLPPTGGARHLRVAVIGYTGYSGIELVGLLERHPAVALLLLDHRAAKDSALDASPVPCGLPTTSGIAHAPWSPSAIRDHQIDLVFTATPPEVSLEIIPEILRSGARAIDLSGAFRLRDAGQYQRWYKAAHTQPDLLAQAVYGLPELYREKIVGARLVANPGCYPTAAICALWPLLKADMVDRAAGVVCDAKSGVSGAGKSPSPKTHFVQISENFSAYAILEHRHVAEVLNNTGLDESEFSFTAQLLPIPRGILAANYLRLKKPATLNEIQAVYRAAYSSAGFVRLYPQGSQPQLSVVNHTNFCDIHCTLGSDGKRLVVVSCIDNLVKGAAGQAVQNMNVMFGLEESTGLLA
ncbi:MAG: N-acetyl-gamma-glutamyl-phosphate reductase [Acidobacteria bacterium]|nr:N-acetyl-gamma-glutamyl-phosphate reductase [Acidobacteriota bacterium]